MNHSHERLEVCLLKNIKKLFCQSILSEQNSAKTVVLILQN